MVEVSEFWKMTDENVNVIPLGRSTYSWNFNEIKPNTPIITGIALTFLQKFSLMRTPRILQKVMSLASTFCDLTGNIFPDNQQYYDILMQHSTQEYHGT